MDQTKASQIMNLWGQERKPFFFLIDFEMHKIKLWEKDRLPSSLLYQIGNNSNFIPLPGLTSIDPLKGINPINFETYEKQFNAVKEEIHYGNSFLLNLTASTELIGEFNLKEIFHLSHAKYKVLLEDQFVCYSPECFIKIENNQISSYPMKGTIDARIPGAKEKILNDVKEKAEHNTIVDLIRNDLSRVSKNVRVQRFRFIQRISSHNKDLLQVSSEVRGDLDLNYNHYIGDIIFSLLPAGSISGAPKKKTIEIIRNLEQKDRGYYTGIAGFYDGVNLDSCVMIRYIENNANKYYYRSGGGITSLSDVHIEYNELIQKIYVPTH